MENDVKLNEVLDIVDNGNKVERNIKWLFSSKGFKPVSIVASKYSRILEHLKSGKSFSIISGFRPLENDYEVNSQYYREQENKNYKINLDRNKKLAIDIRNNGFGFIQLEGFWKGIDENNEEYEQKENSFFVIGYDVNNDIIFTYEVFKNIMIELQLQYDQEGVITGQYNEKQQNFNIEMTNKNGDVEVTYDNISFLSEDLVKEMFEKIKESGDGAGYSKLKNKKNRRFIFSGIYSYHPQSLFMASNFYNVAQNIAYGLNKKDHNTWKKGMN